MTGATHNYITATLIDSCDFCVFYSAPVAVYNCHSITFVHQLTNADFVGIRKYG